MVHLMKPWKTWLEDKFNAGILYDGSFTKTMHKLLQYHIC